ncbi:MAG: dCTP deaminase [Candidatus Thermoplasmatota archaeon]|nr:dCTP deaminase [Candidatus Thermoplasmatota archaeon]
MILSDGTIRRNVLDGKLISKNYAEESLTPNGYDLRVGSIMIPPDAEQDSCTVPASSRFLVSTMEEIHCPENICGQIFIRSSFARKGIFSSFGFVDAGFHGELTLSFYNASSVPFAVSRGERIAQIVFMAVDKSVENTYEKRSGNYQNSRGIRI